MGGMEGNFDEMRERVDVMAMRAQEMILLLGVFEKAPKLWDIQRDFERRIFVCPSGLKKSVFDAYASELLDFCEDLRKKDES